MTEPDSLLGTPGMRNPGQDNGDRKREAGKPVQDDSRRDSKLRPRVKTA
jgi:hypothetical protein